MAPRMIVVAGPPGSGKSSLYPLSSFNVEYFKADDRAAELNGGSYSCPCSGTNWVGVIDVTCIIYPPIARSHCGELPIVSHIAL
jgi:hypothetical protein